MTDWKVHSHRRYVMQVCKDGTLASGDGAALGGIPFNSGYLVAVIWGLDAGGSSSGNTSLMLNLVTAESDTEVISAVDSIAHDATTLYSTIDSFQNNEFSYGDILRFDIDAIPGGSDSAGFWATAIFHIHQD